MTRPALRWVAPAGDAAPLGERLSALGVDAGALGEGRVFLDGRRASEAAESVAGGAIIELYAARVADGEVTILATHGGLVFAAKPAGMATEPDHAGVGASLVARVAELVGVPRGTLHALSRLDVGVSGIVTLARDAAARSLVEDLRQRGRFTRRYVAIAARAPTPASGEWSQAIGRGSNGRRRAGGSDSQAAITRYATAGVAGSVRLADRGAQESTCPALLALAPVTGRTHQLRVHAAAAHTPLLGDTTYGGPRRLLGADGSVHSVPRVALHAAAVELVHAGQPLRVEAPFPADLLALWESLGGAAAVWQQAAELPL
jgi:tRNA pseudouridine32 synthase/23S rRNA pseudouridine746 synthase